MSARPIIYTSLGITPAGDSETVYDKQLTEGVALTVEEVTSLIEDGQTSTDGYDLTISVETYDLDILDNAGVNTDASEAQTKSTIELKGAVGAADRKVEGIYLNGKKIFDGNRTKAVVMGTKRVARLADTVVETEVDPA